MRESTRATLTDGLYTGLVGYGVVVLSLALVNVARGQSPFYTAALFGSTLFYGLDDPAALQVAAGPVLAYNMVHLLVFLTLGFFTSWLVTVAERYPVTRFLVLFTLIFVAGHVYGALLLFAQPLLAEAAWWQIGVASALAAIAMAGYLLHAHPALRRSLREIPIGAEAD